jgi:putative solute:sodium symporter small subunit
MTSGANHRAYWRANLKLGAVLLSIWFLVSFVFGILLVEPLNRITFFGFKLGFWWAQQGSIFVFIVLIFVYSALMKRLDRKYGVHDDED